MKKSTARSIVCAGGILLSAVSAPAMAGSGPQDLGSGLTLDPMGDLRLRLENVEQTSADATAITARMRAGLELKSDSGFAVLAEAEATLGIVNDYNDGNASNGAEPFATIADPENVELNRLQLSYSNKAIGKLTVGRQRIILGDSRWVGNVGWRQNEQTFDAVRLETAKFGPVSADLIYSNSQRTIWGVDGGARTAFDGDFMLGNLGVAIGPVKATGFAYLLDYEAYEAGADTQTYGIIANADLPLSQDFKIGLKASYAKQKDYKDNGSNFSVDYYLGEATASTMGFALTGGYEVLGADGAGNRLQTPFATLHKFNGTADIFLITPANGLEDIYVTLGKKIPVLGGVTAEVSYHDFKSNKANIDYGSEWDAQLGFKIAPIGVTVKYANYNAASFGTDTQKLWLDLSYSF